MANSKAIDVRATRRQDLLRRWSIAKAFQEGVGRLLAEVQRIKSEGDYEAAKALFETYGVHFDPALRDEVVARVDQLQHAVLHRLRPAEARRRSQDADGAITDVKISYPMDLTTQMLEYSGRRE